MYVLEQYDRCDSQGKRKSSKFLNINECLLDTVILKDMNEEYSPENEEYSSHADEIKLEQVTSFHAPKERQNTQ